MPAGSEKDGWFLSGEEILAVRRREYHYNAWSSTLLDPYLQPFWRLVVSYVPKYVTPSTLSVCGLLCNIVAVYVTVGYSPNLVETLPPWVCILNALSIFLYQTFDGIDGKQCFRTQNSEVEEYADHAVDSISVTLNAILLAAALQLGDSWFLLAANFTLALSAFYAAHWAAHTTHSLVFGHVDVSEAQLSMIMIHLVTAIRGPALWITPIYTDSSINIRDAVCVISAATLLFGTFGNMSIALGVTETPLERNGIHIPRRSFSLWPLTTYITIIAGLFLCIKYDLLTELTVPVMLIVGLSLGKAGTRLILQKLTTQDGGLFDESMLFPPALVALRSYCGYEHDLLRIGAWTLVAVLAADVVLFHAHATSDLKRARDINVFTMRKAPGQAYPKDAGFYVSGGNLRTVQKAWQEFSTDASRVKATYPL